MAGTWIAVHDVIGLLQNSQTVESITANRLPMLTKAATETKDAPVILNPDARSVRQHAVGRAGNGSPTGSLHISCALRQSGRSALPW